MAKSAKAQARWAERIGEQEASGQTVRAFCRRQGIGEHSFYSWRKRLRTTPRVEFALLETKSPAPGSPWTLEVSLSSGTLLRISNGVDAATLRQLLETLRA